MGIKMAATPDIGDASSFGRKGCIDIIDPDPIDPEHMIASCDARPVYFTHHYDERAGASYRPAMASEMSELRSISERMSERLSADRADG